jgi:diguanylate cyclase (GGDEF)-like protein
MSDRAPEAPGRQGNAEFALCDLPFPACLCDAVGGVVRANQLWKALLVPHGANGTAPLIAESARNVRAHLHEAVTDGLPSDLEISVRDADGQQRSFAGRCAGVSVPDEPEAVALCILVDITEIRRREAQLAFMATHDPLTGLPNRRMFEDALVRAGARARRGKTGALLMLDIDNLKSYNDALGHNQGDQALVNFALLLQTHVRAGDMLARVGGDEFGVVLEAATLEEAVEIGERMRKAAAEEPFVSDARAFELGLSGGIVPSTAPRRSTRSWTRPTRRSTRRRSTGATVWS